MSRPSRAADSVFINCPFDGTYSPLFEVLVYAVLACGFTPRSALEIADSGDVRVEKIKRLIAVSRFGIHDISRVQLDAGNQLPRFNMPFELGLDVGCRAFGTTLQRRKKILVLDAEPYRFQKFLSDIAGQDIKHHGNDPDQLLRCVRDWLRTTSGRSGIAGQDHIAKSFRNFSAVLPDLCIAGGLDRATLTYPDYVGFADDWLQEHPIA